MRHTKIRAHSKKGTPKKGTWPHGHSRHMGTWAHRAQRAHDLSYSGGRVLPVPGNGHEQVTKPEANIFG